MAPRSSAAVARAAGPLAVTELKIERSAVGGETDASTPGKRATDVSSEQPPNRDTSISSPSITRRRSSSRVTATNLDHLDGHRSGVTAGAAAGGGTVAAAEQDRVDEQRLDLPERHPLLVSGRERPDLLVGGDRPGRDRAEQPHHREVDLAVGAMRGWLDQPRPSVGGGEDVAAPEV